MTVKKALVSAFAPVYIRARLAQEWLQTGVVWWPLAPSHVADPYPVYRKLRDKDPVHRSRLTQQFVVARYADIDRILRDHRSFSNDFAKAASTSRPLATRRKLKPSILSLDPPDHTRLRRLVNRAFTPRQVAKMEDHIRATAHALLDRVGGMEEFDLMKALAIPLPTLVIARMIGVPEDDLAQFKVWSDRFARVLEPSLTEKEQELVLQTNREFGDYFTGIIEQRRREPRDDLVSRLVEAEEEGDKLNAEETRVMLRLLLVAGNETTTNLIGNGMRALLRHPRQLRLLREQPELVPAAVEELLRYDSPVQIDGRVALRDLEVGGVRVKAGSLVASCSDPPTATPSSSSAPRNSTSPGRTRETSRSAGASITAWARRWPGWKGGSCSRCCWNASSGSDSGRGGRGTGRASFCEGSSTSTCGCAGAGVASAPAASRSRAR